MINRWFARLGEHDYRTNMDGRHQDVVIADAQGHPDYNKPNITSDIAVLRLERDVIFNGVLNNSQKILALNLY